jgi:hypothetical protein
MKLEIGERIIYRSLEWEVQDTSSEAHVELFGRSQLHRGKVTYINEACVHYNAAVLPVFVAFLAQNLFATLSQNEKRIIIFADSRQDIAQEQLSSARPIAVRTTQP